MTCDPADECCGFTSIDPTRILLRMQAAYGSLHAAPPHRRSRQYAERIDTRIILIDGTELARLMIAHGVGVTPVAVYELKRVDSDFFAED